MSLQEQIWDPKKIHFMLDFETLALTPKAIILSIGCVKFNEFGVLDKFYIECDKGSQIGHRDFDRDTADWWAIQHNKPTGITSLYTCLHKLLNFLQNNTPPSYEMELWAKGTDFDIPILLDALASYGINPPFPYRNKSDLRTLKKYHPEVHIPFANQQEHNALEDAIFQANQAVWILNSLVIQKENPNANGI